MLGMVVTSKFLLGIYSISQQHPATDRPQRNLYSHLLCDFTNFNLETDATGWKKLEMTISRK